MVLYTATGATGVEWLQSNDVVRPDGAVMSWVNPAHPGYPYPEIAGYLLSLLALEGAHTAELRNGIAARLVRDLSPAGAVGRGGIDYVFDSAMALSGLLAHQRAGGLADDSTIDRLYEFIVDRLSQRHGLAGDPAVAPSHWSASYGSHLLKTVLAITSYAEDHRAPTAPTLVAQLLQDLLPLSEQGRFRANALTASTYAHSHCYAVEGLLVLEGRGLASVGRAIVDGADWLTSVQLADGGISSTHDGVHALGVAHTDCTAQAVRIWACVDRQRYADAIAKGVDFLTRMNGDGGFRYGPGSDDINTWATMFSVQALRWAETGGHWSWMV